MGLHELGGNDEAEARSTLFGRSLEGLEEIFARLLGNAGAVVHHIDDDLAALAMGCDPNLAVGLVVDALDGLHGIADQIREGAE